jgi:hypothetical protein
MVHKTVAKQDSSCTTVCLVERLNMYQKKPFIPLKLNFTSNMNYCYLKQLPANWQLHKEMKLTISISPHKVGCASYLMACIGEISRWSHWFSPQ